MKILHLVSARKAESISRKLAITRYFRNIPPVTGIKEQLNINDDNLKKASR